MQGNLAKQAGGLPTCAVTELIRTEERRRSNGIRGREECRRGLHSSRGRMEVRLRDESLNDE